jgi:hypothetical protein
VLAAGAAAAVAQSASAQTLTAVDVHPSDYPTVEAVRWMGEEIARETGGRIDFRLYPSGQLGSETDTVNLALFGVLDIARVYLGAVNNAFPATLPLALPYIFRDEGHMRRVCDGPIGRDILATFETRGLVGLAFYDSGMRSMYNARRAIHTPADMRGLKVRVPLHRPRAHTVHSNAPVAPCPSVSHRPNDHRLLGQEVAAWAGAEALPGDEAGEFVPLECEQFAHLFDVVSPAIAGHRRQVHDGGAVGELWGKPLGETD